VITRATCSAELETVLVGYKVAAVADDGHGSCGEFRMVLHSCPLDFPRSYFVSVIGLLKIASCLGAPASYA